MADGYQNGNFIGYKAYFRFKYPEDNKWELIPYKQSYAPEGVFTVGIPYPMWNGGILQQMYLLGFEQANAIAYSFAAKAEATGKSVEIKIEPFKVKYSIEYDKIKEEECKP